MNIVAICSVMNLEISVRNVHFSFLEKELYVRLVPSGSGTYTFPEGLELLKSTSDFSGQVNRLPMVKNGTGGDYLAFDCYSLNKPELLLATTEGDKWMPLQEARQLDQDIAVVIEQTLKKLREELNYQPITYYLLPTIFTMQELVAVYEAILEKTLNRGNFYRKMMRIAILDIKGVQRTGKAHKSPILYTFNHSYFDKIKEGLFSTF